MPDIAPERDSRCCVRLGGPGPPCVRTFGSSGRGRAASRASENVSIYYKRSQF